MRSNYKLRDTIKKIRIWLMETFLVPVVVSKCKDGRTEHDFKIVRFSQYRIGKAKYSVTTHKCKYCKLVKKYNTKY